MASDKLSHVGGYEINNLYLMPYVDGQSEDPIDPRPNMAELNLYEDIESNTMSGELILEENSGLEDEILQKDLILYVDISTPGEPDRIRAVYYVYHIERREISQRHIALILHITSIDEIKNTMSRVNRKVGASSGNPRFSSNTMIGDLSKLLFDPIPNGLDVHDYNEAVQTDFPVNDKPILYNTFPVNRVQFMSNKWRPFRCINYMVSRALSDSNSASYVFFERTDGYMLFNMYDGFVDATINVEQLPSYFYKPGRTEGHAEGDDVNVRYNQVLSLHRFDENNEIDNALSGVYGSNLNKLDLLTKRYEEWQFDPITQKQTLSHISETADSVLWRNEVDKKDEREQDDEDTEDSKPTKRPYGVDFQKGKQHLFHTDKLNRFNQRTINRAVSQSYAKSYGYKIDLDDGQSPENWLQHRMQVLGEMYSLHFQIASYGKTSYHAGQFVKLFIPARRPLQEDDSAENILDQRESGVYLVSKIRHQFTPSNHIVHMDLMRDSYSSSKHLPIKDIGKE